MDKPRRAFEVTIKATGNSWVDVLRHLRSALRDCACDGAEGVASTTAGLYTIDVYHDPTQTPEKYYRELVSFLDERIQRT